MIDHVSITVSKLPRSMAFYEAVLAPLGYSRMVTREATVGFGKKYPEFWLYVRPGAKPIGPESGAHVALRARSKEQVDAFHAAALANGGACEGPPGIRELYDPRYYAAFIRDPDGNRIEAVTFVEEHKG